jgi:hypothetical protein
MMFIQCLALLLGPHIMYTQSGTPMTQHQQVSKQQGQHYNHTNPSAGMSGNEDYYSRGATTAASSNKDGQYMYHVSAGQGQLVQAQSVGQQQGSNKHHPRTNNNVYHNQQNQQRSYQ